ncbi:MAG: MATE family efflux transporter, partial [Spirochaetaceae bacterium]|nr:MATE family efflux transporter [Spirochaetaceae bacterium]
TGQISFVLIILLNTIFISAGIFMAQYKGADDKENMKQVFRFKLVISAAVGIIVTVGSIFFPREITSIMLQGNLNKDLILAESEKYMRALALSWIPTCISGAVATSLRETGCVKPPLIISVTATLINTFFNWILIYGNLGAPRMEVVGAATATVIAKICEMTAFLIYLFVKKPDFATKVSKLFVMRMKLFTQIFLKSSMVLISEMAWVISETVATAIFNGRGGAETVAGLAAGFNLSNLLVSTFAGVFTITAVVVGSKLGEGNLSEAKRNARWILSFSPFLGGFAMIVGFFATFLLPVVFGNLSADALKIAFRVIIVFSLYMPAWTYVNAQLAVSRAGGDTLMGAVMDTSVILILFFPILFILAATTKISPPILYAIVKSTDFVKILFAHIWLKKERWLRNLTTHLPS